MVAPLKINTSATVQKRKLGVCLCSRGGTVGEITLSKWREGYTENCGPVDLCILQTTSLSSSLLSPWVQSECPSFPHPTLGLRKRESYTVPNPKRSPRPTSRVFLLRSTCFKDGPVCILQSPPYSRRYSTDTSFSSLKIAGECFTSHRNVNFNKEIARGHTSPLHHYHHKHTQQQFTNTCDPQVSSP